jgi:hypothetical protein
VSSWLRKARQRIVAFEFACGGYVDGRDLCSGNERSLIRRALALVDELSALEVAFDFFTVCGEFDFSAAELIAAAGATGATDAERTARERYFCAATDLRFLLRVFEKRQATRAA